MEGPRSSLMANFDFFQFIGQSSRDACFFEKNGGKVDLSAICHEVRSVEVAQGERVYVSLLDMSKETLKSSKDLLTPLGRACHVKSAEIDATLLLRVWASRDAEAGDSSVDAMAPHDGNHSSRKPRRRLCGELRVPLQRLVLHCHSMLYQSWVTLDSPGILDTVAATGALGDDGGAFDQKLLDGPMKLFQPRVCISICKTPELSTSGKLHLSFEAPQEGRISQWGPLLRSQQQHYVMSKALHLQSQQSKTQEQPDSPGEQELQEIRDRVKDQTETIEELRRELAKLEGLEASTPSSQNLDGMEEAETIDETVAVNACGSSPRGAAQHLADEAERLRDQVAAEVSSSGFSDSSQDEAEKQRLQHENDRKRAEIENMRGELDKVREEANNKIDAANDRIRMLRRDRDDARKEYERLNLEARQLNGQTKDLTADLAQLGEQKEALVKIVDDLHQTTLIAGLKTEALQGARASIDSIKASFRLS